VVYYTVLRYAEARIRAAACLPRDYYVAEGRDHLFANHHLTLMIQHYNDFGLLMQARLQTQSKCGGYNYSSSQHLAQSLEPSLMLNQFAKNLPHPFSKLLSQKSLRTIMSSPMLTAQQSSFISLYFVCFSLVFLELIQCIVSPLVNPGFIMLHT
jgi:hypothetical protein